MEHQTRRGKKWVRASFTWSWDSSNTGHLRVFGKRPKWSNFTRAPVVPAWYDRASPTFLMPSSQQEQLTFGSLTDEIFVFLATFREFPAIFQDFYAFIFIKTSRNVADPLDGRRIVKRFSIVPHISACLMPKRQPNPHGSALCVLERQVMNKLHFFFIGYAYQVSSKPKHPLKAVDQENLRG